MSVRTRIGCVFVTFVAFFTFVPCFPFFPFVVAPAPTHASPPSRLDELAWIAGDWSASKDGVHLEEQWSAPRNDLMVGMFRWTNPDGARFVELMTIREENGEIYFRLRHFNPDLEPWEKEDETPFTHRLVRLENREAVFENPDWDHPRRFVYRGIGEDQLAVRLVGIEGGQESADEYVFSRAGEESAMSAENAAPEIWGVEYGVRDVGAAADFYVAALGFEEESRDPKGRWTVLTNNSSRLILRQSNVPLGEDGAARVFLNLRVGELESVMAACEKAGGRVPEATPREIPIGRSIRVQDPSGNPLHLIEHSYYPLSPEDSPLIYNVSVYSLEIEPGEEFYTSLGFRVMTRDYLPETLVFEKQGIPMVLHRWAESPAATGSQSGALLVHDAGRHSEPNGFVSDPEDGSPYGRSCKKGRDPSGNVIRVARPPGTS